ncbi:MAG: PSD1 and planctomycete cytochrome C domain-containing protein [Planctomycetota bacterium]|nr:PSD1 and planctomycete cytochrome C domain-containing protein [Planctomycetota bacterium]
MPDVTRSSLFVLLLALWPCLAVAEDKIEFQRSVLPILSSYCFPCHGPDAGKRKAKLRLDQRESAVGKARSGRRAIVPGDSLASELVRRITAEDEDDRMPPADQPLVMSPAQVSTLKKWIEQGGEYRKHWSFEAPKKAPLPALENSRRVVNDIDRFVFARLEYEGLMPAPEASRESLVRSVSFDLTGLPPPLEEVDAFLSDKSPKAYARMVDRFLGKPAYGEHLARHWLDLARYADTNGYQYDTERQQWVWRDWVIDAYNTNKSFDQFTIEQLAGDLLPGATDQQELATGFNRNHGITIEGGIIDEEYRTEYVMDRVVTTSEVWLGMTLACARCHDHKFDDLSQKEFYQVYAFFNQVPERGANGFSPKKRLASPLGAARQLELTLQLNRLKDELSKPMGIEGKLERWAKGLAGAPGGGWEVLTPREMKASGGSTLKRLKDNSVLAGGADPRKNVYDISTRTEATGITAVRLEALTHASLPGGGPGRHSNSNFVLSEFELTVISEKKPGHKEVVQFVRARADYSQAGYEVANAIDRTVAGNNGWAVDGPTRKKPATAIFVPVRPFGFKGGSRLSFRLRHEASFANHGIGRPRLSVSTDSPDLLQLKGVPADIRKIAAKAAGSRKAAESARLREYFLAKHDPRKGLQDQIAAIEKKKAASFPETMIMQDLPRPRATHILHRGQYNEPGKKVQPGVPAIFPGMKKNRSSRLGFAQWLVDPQHPLTARVAVNRHWQRIFGLGLVKTSEDFGVRGELPSHPLLLDWLAVEFIRSGWDTKQLQRLILNSATYRQSSHVGADSYRKDPENRLLARGPRMRLDAEEIRDASLAVSGLLVSRLGGKSVYPYQPKGLWMELNNRPGYSREYKQGTGADLYRRSIYTFWKRTVPSPMLKTFDAPEREFCTIRRSRTNTPLQALVLLNGPQFVEAARKLGERMIVEGGKSLAEKISHGFRLVTARRPKPAELEVLEAAYRAALKRYAGDEAGALRLLKVGESSYAAEVDVKKLAALAEVARLLLNINEAITKG